MRKIVTKGDRAISRTLGVSIIVAIVAVSTFSILITQGVQIPFFSSTPAEKVSACTNLTSTGGAFGGFNTTVCFDITNFTLKSVNNSKIGISLLVFNASGSFVYQGNLGEKSLSPYNSTVTSSSNNFSVNSKYTIQIYGSYAPITISLIAYYSGNTVYNSGKIYYSSPCVQDFSILEYSCLFSSGNNISGYNTSVYLNISSTSKSVPNSLIGIIFNITNSTGTYNYKGYLNGNIRNVSSNASIATLVSNSTQFSSGNSYLITLFGHSRTSSVDISLYNCASIIAILNMT